MNRNENTYAWDIYEAWFFQIEGIGREKMNRLSLSEYSFKDLYQMDNDGLHKIIEGVYKRKEEGKRQITSKTLEKNYTAILDMKQKITPEALYESYSKHNIYYVNQKNADYPSKLATIPDPPFAFYRKGQAFDMERKRPVLAIVGARLCSEYGKYVARQLGEMAARMGFEVISGLASGVDGISQNAARLAGGEVTAVLGCGVDICYPKENLHIYNRILENGRLISEYPPGTQPLAHNFPPRNRIIAGLADALIVVEAKKRSGTLITVDMALEQGRDVYIIPGRVTDPMSYGCNNLIAQGAQGIVDMTETLLEIRDKSLHKIRAAESGKQNVIDKQMDYNENLTYASLHNDKIEALLFNCIDIQPKSIQEIYEQINQITEISIQKLQEKLLYMEMFGEIEECGGYYHRKLD